MPQFFHPSRTVRHSSYRWSHGFTLFEILIVIVIISIVLSLALLPVSLAKRDVTETEARRLGALLRYAADNSLLTSRHVGIKLDSHGYSFLTRVKNGWEPLKDEILRKRELPDTLSLRINDETPDNQRYENDIKKSRPNIIISSSGEATPAAISIHGPDAVIYTIAIDASSSIELEKAN